MVLVKENFDRSKAASVPQISVWAGFKEISHIPQLTALFAVSLLIQFAMMSPMPLIPLYVQQLHGTTENLAFWAGFVGSVTGLSNMIASPLLGRLSDRKGAELVLGVSLVGAGLMFIPQAFVSDVWQLLAVRFLLGIFLGGLIPSVNALIRKHTPDGMESRAYSFNSSTLSLGNVLGPIVGGAASGVIGIEGVFLVAAALFFLNAVWVRTVVIRPAVRRKEQRG